MNAQILWYLARACGITAWLMLTASVLLGIVLSTDLFPRSRRPAWLLGMHRWLAMLTFFFLAGHIGMLLADTKMHFSALDMAVPFHSSWRPTAVTVGVVSIWLLLAVALTAMAGKRLAKNWWRGSHVFGYWVFWGASIHAALSGTDASKTLYMVTSVVVVAVVAFATSYRVLSHHLPKRSHRPQTIRTGSTPAVNDGAPRRFTPVPDDGVPRWRQIQ